MKSLQEYIVENIINIFENFSKYKSELQNQLRKYLVDNGYKNNEDFKSYSKDKRELYRIQFKDMTNDDIINFLKKAFDGIDGLEVTDEYGVFGRENHASSKFISYAIKYNGEIFYIANWSKSGDNSADSKLKSKDLNPQKLGLKNKYIITDINKILKSQFFNDVEYGLKKITDKRNAEEVYNLCMHLIRIIVSGDIESKNGTFNIDNISDFISNKEEGLLEYKLKNDVIEEIKNVYAGDIANIEKDFGEILGPFLFARLFKKDDTDLVIEFPNEANAAMVDYIINGYKISAKQWGGGGKPSGSALMTSAVKNALKGQPNELMKNINDNEENQYKDEELDFINNVASTYELNTASQQLRLIQNYINKDLKIFDFDLSDCENNQPYKAYLLFVKKIKEDINKKNVSIKEYIQTIFDKIQYDCSKTKYKYTPEFLEKNWKSYDTNKAAGVIIYPIWTVVINKINKKYGDGDYDVITSVLQREIDMKQVYFGIRNKECKMKVIDAKGGTWRFDVGGMSATNISNSKMSIKLH